MGDGDEGGDKDRGNGADAGDVLKGNSTVDDVIWERELGGDWGHVKVTRGISSSGSHKDCGDYGAAYDKQSVGVALSG